MSDPIPSAAALLHALTFTCPACGATEPGSSAHFRCACGTPFDLAPAALPLEPLDATTLRQQFAQRLGAVAGSARSGVWRYRELVLPLPEDAIVTRAEGNTPLHAVGASAGDAGWRRIGEFAGLERLWLKHEGENPTGSFKDRGMTVGMSVAR
ncbi:MAG TPA: hypothetical protein VF725_05390, partial [Ktedonobacterales bacterium]